MKKVITFALTLVCSTAFAQATVEKSSEVPLRVTEASKKIAPEDLIYDATGLDVQPDFPGGKQAFEQYFRKNFTVAPKLRGRIIATFIVEKDGTLSDIKILRNLGDGTAEEALRILKDSPKWTPGMMNGKTVRTLMSAPFAIGTP